MNSNSSSKIKGAAGGNNNNNNNKSKLKSSRSSSKNNKSQKNSKISPKNNTKRNLKMKSTQPPPPQPTSECRISKTTELKCNNSREREKTQSVNTAFTLLRTLIPTEPADRKLSKIETLRLASSYITHLSHHILHDPLDFFGTNQEEELMLMESPQKICTFCLAESKKSKFTSITDINYIPTNYSAVVPDPSSTDLCGVHATAVSYLHNNNHHHHHHQNNNMFY